MYHLKRLFLESPSLDESPEKRSRIRDLEEELSQAKDAIASLKLERKKLKSEKLDLLSQMKQLYSTLDDKEKELRDFIRNYEQVRNIYFNFGLTLPNSM